MSQPIQFDNPPTHVITFAELSDGILISMCAPENGVAITGRLDWDQLNQFTEWLAMIGSDIPSSDLYPDDGTMNTDYTPYD